MPFRARVNPASLARRARPLPPTATATSAAPSLSLPRQAKAGPGPSTAAFQARAYHSTPPARGLGSFFGFGAKTPTSATDAVLTAAAAGARDLPRAWKSYTEELEAGRTRALSADEAADLLAAIEGVQESSSGPAPGPLAAVAVQAYEGVPEAEREQRHHRAAVRILARFPFKFGRRMAVDVAAAQPEDMGREEWAALVAAAEKQGELAERVAALLPADDWSFYTLANQLRERSDVTRADVADLVAMMERRGVRPGPWAEVPLAQLYTAIGDQNAARAIIDRWARADAETDPNAEIDTELAEARWRAKIWIAVQQSDAAAVRAALSQTPYRAEPPIDGLVFLVLSQLPASPEASDVINVARGISDEIGYALPGEAWDGVLQALVQQAPPDRLKPVWDVYRAARPEGGIPSSDLAMAFIERLCALEPPLFDEAVEVYTDLTTAEAIHGSPLRTQTFVDMLGAALRAKPSPDVREAVFSQILVDMATRFPVRLDKVFATSLVTSLWERFADTHVTAYDMYDAVLGVSQPLDGERWETLLLRFIALSFPNSAVPTPDILVRMLGDMRAAGHSPGPRILTGLLTSYADMAKVVRRHDDSRAVAAVHSELLSAARNVQALLSLDSGLAVDARLLTSLIDAFQSCGAFDDALGVWGDLVRRHATFAPEDMGAAVGVMLDACGYAEQPGRGAKIWAWARKRGYVRTARDWAPWVEMLARLGRFDEAVNAVVEMQQQGPRATVEVGLIPLKFARGEPGRVQAVRERLVDAFPKWEEALFRATES